MVPGRRSGELYRELMEAGTMTIAFTSLDGAFNTSYDFEIPAGAVTQFNTVSYVDGSSSPKVTSISLSTDTIALGEPVTVNIEADGGIGYSWVNVNARNLSDNDTYQYDPWVNRYAWGSDYSESSDDSSFAPQLRLKAWSLPGEWIIENFYINDQYGGYGSYIYRPDISETHYVREYNQYDSINYWNWKTEVSNLPLLRFTVTGDYQPDLLLPEIQSVSLSSSTVALGETLTVNIEASDDMSGICWVNVNARVYPDNYTGPYWWNSHSAWTQAWNDTGWFIDNNSYYYGSCEGDGINFPDDGTITLAPELWIRGWSSSGEWLIDNFHVNDRAGRWSNYSYRPDISETHYVRGYDRYDNNTHWGWVEEETTLPLMRFTVTGDSTPDLQPPEITNISLASDTVALGETLTVNIEASDDVSGICSVNVNARMFWDNYTDPYWWYGYYAYGYAWNDAGVPIIEDSPYYYYNSCERAEIEFPDNGTITLVPELWFGSEHMPGEWLIENFYVNDRAGRWNNYSYRPDISETHYVRSYDRYDNNTHWSWVEEESTLLLLKFNVTGDSSPSVTPTPAPTETPDEQSNSE